MALFRADVVHLDGGVTVTLAGELDLAGVAELRGAVWPLLRRYDADQVVLDCGGLRFIDGSGVGQLLAASDAFGGGRLVLRDVGAQVRRVLELTGALDAFHVEHSDELASPQR